MDLSGLPALVAVADKRSFTAAAAELGVSPSALSQAVRALEERIGVRLLQRTTRSVGLTEAGAVFLARVRPALDGVREAMDAVGQLRDRPAGTLRLAVSRMAYAQVLAPKLPRFMARYPEIRVELDVSNTLVDIAASGFDAGIRIGEMVERDMISVRVGPELSSAVVGSPAYFGAHPRPSHPRDLHAHDCISYRRSDGSLYRWEFTERGRDFEVAVAGRIVIDDGDFMIDAAIAGLGLAHVPDAAVRAHVKQKRLVRVLEAYCPPYAGFHLFYPSRAQLAPKLQAFVQFFRLAGR